MYRDFPLTYVSGQDSPYRGPNSPRSQIFRYGCSG